MPSQFEYFEGVGSDWEPWRKRFEQWFSLQQEAEQTPERKRALLLVYIGNKHYQLLQMFCQPKQPEEVSIDVLLGHLDTHFDTVRFTLVERSHFHSCIQKPHRSLDQYVQELQTLTLHCKFSTDELPGRLRDQFVLHLRDSALKTMLLRMDYTKPFAEFLSEAHTFAAAGQQTHTSAAIPVAAVHSGRSGQPKKRYKQPSAPTRSTAVAGAPSSAKPCGSCGGAHRRDACKFRKAKCYKCNKQGHIADASRNNMAAVTTNDGSLRTVSVTSDH